MGVVIHLTTIGSINSVTTSYWVENLHLSFVVPIKRTHEFNEMGWKNFWWLNEMGWKNFEKDRKIFGNVLGTWQKNPVEKQHLQNHYMLQ